VNLVKAKYQNNFYSRKALETDMGEQGQRKISREDIAVRATLLTEDCVSGNSNG
jgi:hypothetical protein